MRFDARGSLEPRPLEHREQRHQKVSMRFDARGSLELHCSLAPQFEKTFLCALTREAPWNR